ncbi:MAG: hypothetical protein KDI36_12755 [Pseudomonadales bacterium]|nr:hypothetical protein [Pseudomonadales bacterium]
MAVSLTSRTEKPDLDWSQVRETVVMLYLSAAQIESAMREGNQSVHDLTDAFTRISAASDKFKKAVTESHDSLLDAARVAAADIDQEVQGSVVAFQFHDRITQRLNNVTSALRKLSELIGSSERLYNPAEWRMLQVDIKNGYTMEAERLMFEHIMMGATVEEALAIYEHNFNKDDEQDQDSDDDIEFF